MDFLIASLPVLACVGVMFLCMRHMSMGSKPQSDEAIDVATKQEIAELREEVARLRAERALSPVERAGDG